MALGPLVDLRVRIPIAIALLIPIPFVPDLPLFWRLVACIVPLAVTGTFRITRIHEGWIDTRLFMGFIPVRHHRCKLATVVALGVKYGGSEPGIGTFVLLGPMQYVFGYLFDFLIPAIGGPYELSLETAKGREFMAWQGFNQEYFEKNLELLKNQTGAEIKSR
jgi:hypothetical protein